MNEQREQNLNGVVCLHCGADTPLPASTRRSLFNGMTILTPAVSIVRCHSCGKEAPYLADQIVVIHGLSNALRSAA
jgi:hypothetical protein